MQSGSPIRILLTGASGYVGGRLLPRLEAAEYRLRCLTRRPEVLAGRIAPSTEIVVADLLDRDSLGAAVAGVQAAYYLVHSMGAAGNFEELDRRAALNFAQAAREARIGRIVYLGGLGSGDDLSTHLASRQEVGEILRSTGIPTTELRASIVIGSGSASFETVRGLVEHLPAIPAPHWVENAAQPIAIDDVIDYLVEVIGWEHAGSEIVEIGGRDRVTYAEVMREYARQRRLRRTVIPMPVLSARMSRLFLASVIPGYGRIAAAMVDSLRNETIVEMDLARRIFSIEPRGLAEAIERALSSRVVRVHARGEDAFGPIQRIGGETGWYAADWFWRLRGWIDRLRGGCGMRRGRRDPDDLHVGDTVDFWRVEGLDPGRRLLLAAEMKIPGRLWLQFDVEDRTDGTQIRQTTVFDPGGYVGRVYWYLLYPVHHGIFGAMLRGLRRASQLA